MVNHEFDVHDEDSFASHLATLVQAAHENGVTVDGGWEVNGVDGDPDWDVVITVVERGADDDDD